MRSRSTAALTVLFLVNVLNFYDRQALSAAALHFLQALVLPDETWRLAGSDGPAVDAEVRRLLGQYVTYLQGRRPRMLSYLESVEEKSTGPKRERG